MRKRFEQQLKLGNLQIEHTEIPTSKRSGSLPALCIALKEIYVNPKWNSKVYELLESKLLSKNNHTGRKGMGLWEIFVLSQVRLCQNISYDELHHIANYDTLVRQIMGIETIHGYGEKQEYGYQRIVDNVGLLDDETVKDLNAIIIEFGHEVFKKKEEEALHLKTDSFVVESNVHFPTDYNLTWDCVRKCLDMVSKLNKRHNLTGWRKLSHWNKDIKNKMRSLGRACSAGGKNKQDRVRKTAQKYLEKVKALYDKLEQSKCDFPQEEAIDLAIVIELDKYMVLLYKHIDLLERRIIKGEKIPHAEKMFSIFEEYTEWITKGKMRPSVELGKKTTITTDQYNLIIDYRIMENQADSEIVKDLADTIFSNYTVKTWSFDKGYWHKNNKELLAKKVENLVLPKKGKCNKEESEEEHKSVFKKFRNKHSAIESNINELEHRGLNRCPDKGYRNFKRYVSLAVSAYNLRRIGDKLLADQRNQIVYTEHNQAA